MTSSNPDVSLRKGNEVDAREIAEIWHLGWRDGHLGYVPEALVEARTEESFRARASKRAREATVAVVDGEIAPFEYAAATEKGPIRVPSRRYAKRV